MKREVESSRQLYESLLQRAAETSVAGELETSNVRFVDEAEAPIRPARPQRQLVLLVGLLGGMLIAGGLVFLVEYLDDTIKTSEDVRQLLQVPFLGMVPCAAARRDGAHQDAASSGTPQRGLLLLSPRPSEMFAESIRSVRTGLIFSAEKRDCRSVLVTSTGGGEGKSFMSANLAISLAQMGLSTLLVDADLRRPHLHDLLGLEELEPGLSNLLAGRATEKDVVRRTAVPGLSLVTAGEIVPNPIELMGSARFSHFLTSCRGRFEWIVLDTPPVQPVADAVVLTKAVGEVLFVVAAGRTSQRQAADALERLAQSGVGVVGCVLNQVEPVHRPRYSRLYRRGHDRYFQQRSFGAAAS